MVQDKLSPNTYRNEYGLSDHLGNTRLVFTDINGDGRIDNATEIVQENHYYGFGMQMEGSWNNKSVVGSPKQNYKFNGSEWTDDFGLNWGDHGARYFLPAIAAWNGIDALAETYHSFSPFHFGMNNPISYSDPSGMGATGWVAGSGGGIYFDPNITNATNRAGDMVAGGTFLGDEIYKRVQTWSGGAANFMGHGDGSYEMLLPAATVTAHQTNAEKEAREIKFNTDFQNATRDALPMLNLAKGIATVAAYGLLGEVGAVEAVGMRGWQALKAANALAPRVAGSIEFKSTELFAKYGRHIFSKDHIANGIMDLGANQAEILNSARELIRSNIGLVKNGQNFILKQINGVNATIKFFVNEGKIISVDLHSQFAIRVYGNIIR